MFVMSKHGAPAASFINVTLGNTAISLLCKLDLASGHRHFVTAAGFVLLRTKPATGSWQQRNHLKNIKVMFLLVKVEYNVRLAAVCNALKQMV